MVPARVAAEAALAAAVLVTACQSLVGIEGSPAEPAQGVGGDASPDVASGGQAGAAATGGADSGCGSARPPAAATSASGGGSIDFVVAVRKVDFGDRDVGGDPSWKTLGFDLDDLCTCGSDPQGGCQSPGDTVCDGVDGRDNALGSFLYQIRDVFKLTKLSSESLSATLETGAKTILVRVRGYNGAAYDKEVQVSWYASADFQPTNAAPPNWDGGDAWPVLASSIKVPTDPDAGTPSVDDPLYVDPAAYVADGTLVANLPEGSFGLTLIPALKITAAIFTAEIRPVAGGAWALRDGLLAGMTETGNVFNLLPAVEDPITKQPLCKDNALYSGIKNMICSFADTTVFGSPSKPCDFMSLGIGLEADPAVLGPIVPPDPPMPGCAAGMDPAGDSC